MTQIERAFEIAGLDLESVRTTAGRVHVELVKAMPACAGKWYKPCDNVQRFYAATAFIDIWAVRGMDGKRFEFKLLDKNGNKIVDSTEAKAPINEFFAYPVTLTEAQFKELLQLDIGEIVHQ